jgi:Biotin/lipoate A/B protein ligase family
MDQIPVTITLLPLQVGVLIAHSLQKYSDEIQVKWPNDVLVKDRKIAGVLIENWLSPSNQACWFLIGIGINVAFAPALPPGIRPAICLHEIIGVGDPDVSATPLGTELVHNFLDWIFPSSTNTMGGSSSSSRSSSKADREAQVLDDWKQLVQFGQLYKIRETGEEVTTLGIHSDGQLKVRGADGRERLLMADYLH